VKASGGGLVAIDTEVGAAELINSFCALDAVQRVAMSQAALQGFTRHFGIE
jgi:hypothetical protein